MSFQWTLWLLVLSCGCHFSVVAASLWLAMAELTGSSTYSNLRGFAAADLNP